MTKDELDYERMLKKRENLEKMIADKKKELDRQRDEAIIQAIHTTDITREEGFKLAAIISNSDNLEVILNLKPKEVDKPKKATKKPPKVKVESEEINDEE
jgi:hypothetical protein